MRGMESVKQEGNFDVWEPCICKNPEGYTWE